MKHISTTVSETAIHVRYANDPDPAKATEWIDTQVTLPNAKLPSGTTLAEPDAHRLAGLRLVALLHARDAASEEIQRLSQIANRRP